VMVAVSPANRPVTVKTIIEPTGEAAETVPDVTVGTSHV